MSHESRYKISFVNCLFSFSSSVGTLNGYWPPLYCILLNSFLGDDVSLGHILLFPVAQPTRLFSPVIQSSNEIICIEGLNCWVGYTTDYPEILCFLFNRLYSYTLKFIKILNSAVIVKYSYFCSRFQNVGILWVEILKGICDNISRFCNTCRVSGGSLLMESPYIDYKK